MAIPWTLDEQHLQCKEAEQMTKEEYIAKIMEEGLGTPYNTVSKPKHYMLFDKETVVFFADNEKGIEVRDVIEQLVEKIPFGGRSGMFVSDYVQMMQYLMRFMDKNGKEDLEKARYYLDKMIESY